MLLIRERSREKFDPHDLAQLVVYLSSYIKDTFFIEDGFEAESVAVLITYDKNCSNLLRFTVNQVKRLQILQNKEVTIDVNSVVELRYLKVVEELVQYFFIDCFLYLFPFFDRSRPPVLV